MNHTELVQRLDEFFNIGAYDESAFWPSLLPASDLPVYRRFAEPDFVQSRWNGLMLRSSDEVDRVYLVVFPDQAVLDTILALELERSAPGAMIFAHHPVDFEESGRGFIGISEAQLEELREHHISYYCCHAPLDCNKEISTVGALAKVLKLRELEPFGPHFEGMEGIVGGCLI